MKEEPSGRLRLRLNYLLTTYLYFLFRKLIVYYKYYIFLKKYIFEKKSEFKCYRILKMIIYVSVVAQSVSVVSSQKTCLLATNKMINLCKWIFTFISVVKHYYWSCIKIRNDIYKSMYKSITRLNIFYPF